MIMAFRAYVCERIRTLDLLVRSQTLYPAELHTHIIATLFVRPNNIITAQTLRQQSKSPSFFSSMALMA